MCSQPPLITARVRSTREGNVLTRVCPSVCPQGGGVPVSHNALQHFPECHGAAGGGGTLPGPAQGGYPGRGVPCQVQLGGTLPGPARGGTLAGGYPGWGVPWPGGYPGQGVPWPGGTLAGGVPGQGVPCPGGGTQLGQHREYLLHGGRYASCVHAGGLSCSIVYSYHQQKTFNIM